jgi:hypothetical protein
MKKILSLPRNDRAVDMYSEVTEDRSQKQEYMVEKNLSLVDTFRIPLVQGLFVWTCNVARGRGGIAVRSGSVLRK